MKDKRQVLDLIKLKSSFLLTAHIFPDGDNLASLLALRAGLVHLGKRVQVVIDDDIPSGYHFLADIKNIIQPEDVRPDFEVLIVLDSSSIDRIGSVQAFINEHITVVNIDHHISNTGFGDVQYVDPAATATAEIVYELLSELNIVLDREIASAIFTGIATDCGFFKYANTTAKSMEIAGKMIILGAKPQEISDALETKSPEALKLLARILEHIQITAKGKVAWLSIDENMLTATGAMQEDANGFINYVRYIEGVEVAVLFREVSGSGVKVSMRSKGDIDVSQIAVRFGGGGHQKAAGCSFNTTLNEAKEQVFAVIEEQLDK